MSIIQTENYIKILYETKTIFLTSKPKYDTVYKVDKIMSKNLQQILKNLGLSEKEAGVYLACLELGEATVQEIAEKSEVKRTSVYNFLEDMKGRGLVAEIRRGGKILLSAENPEMLLKQAKENFENLQVFMPEFLGLYNQMSHKPKVKFYQGVEGLKKTYLETLKAEKEIYLISDFEKMFQVVPEDWMFDYARQRSEKNIKAQCLARDSQTARRIKNLDKKQNRETRIFNKDFDLETEINIFGNRVALLSFKKPYIAVIIEDAAIAKTLLSMWKMVWINLG